MTREELFSLELPAWDDAAEAEVKNRWDRIAKPLDSLGEFERIFARIGGLTGDPEIRTAPRTLAVFCADNGIVREGVSQSGQEVTAMVAADLGRGVSNVNRMAARAEVRVISVDMGIAAARTPEGLRDLHVCRGTADFLEKPAMTEQETLDAIKAGMDLAAERKTCGDRILAAGEMGIGNTTTAAAVIAALTGCDAEEVCGRGAGLSDAGLLRKREVLRKAMEKYQFSADAAIIGPEEPLRILSCVGGADIAGICGLILGSALHRIPVVLDGLITASAALAAERILPGARRAMIPSHLGREGGMDLAYRVLGLSPVIHASLALGEGSGAVMLFPLLDTAGAVYDTERTFAQIELEPYRRFQ